MKYPLLIVSHILTKHKDNMVILTFYPSDSACIIPQEDQTLTASFAMHFHPEIELADALSEKGKRRLKILLHRPSFNEDERRTLGSLYFSLLFGHNTGNDEYKKAGADDLYKTVCDLYNSDSSSEEAWTEACENAVERLQILAKLYYIHAGEGKIRAASTAQAR